MNNYTEIAKYYDDIVNSGYYDMPKVVKEYLELIGSKAKRILEVGVGTGGLTVLLKDKYKITGIDFSEALLKIAKEKLKGSNVELLQKDIRELDYVKIFDGAIGHASIFIVIDSKDGVVIESFLTDMDDVKKALVNVRKAIKLGSKFIIDFHAEHTPGKRFMSLPNGNRYEFEIREINGMKDFNKIHWIKDSSGKTIAESKDHKIRILMKEFNDLALECGFSKIEVVGQYLVLIK